MMIHNPTNTKLKMIKKDRNDLLWSLKKANRRYLDSRNRKRRTFSVRDVNDDERSWQVSWKIQPSFRNIIESYQSLTYNLMDVDDLVGHLISQNKLQIFKSVIGLSQLSLQFNNPQLLQRALHLGIIPQLTSVYMIYSDPFIKISSVRLLKTLSYWLPRQEDHSRYLNLQTISVQFLTSLLTYHQSQQTLDLLEELFLKEYQLTSIDEKERLISSIKCRLQNLSPSSFDSDIYKLIKILSKIHLLNYEESEQLIDQVCQTLLRMLQLSRYRQNYNGVFGSIELLLIDGNFVKSVNHILEKEPLASFPTRYPYFHALFMIVMKCSIVVNREVRIFYGRSILKYMTKALSINFLEKMHIFEDIEQQFLMEKIGTHSNDWEIAISSLSIIERLFSKNHKETHQRFLTNKFLLLKIKELYSVEDRYLFEQLNKTISKMISSDNSYHLLQMLRKGGIFKLYLQPCENVNVHQDLVLREMKETYEKVDKRSFHGHSDFMKLLRRSIIESLSQRNWINGATGWRRETNDFYRRLFEISNQPRGNPYG